MKIINVYISVRGCAKRSKDRLVELNTKGYNKDFLYSLS